MTRRTAYTVVCLSGHGIGPEVMAQASRALARVSRLHGFRSRRRTPPFGARGVRTQSGHALAAADAAGDARAPTRSSSPQHTSRRSRASSQSSTSTRGSTASRSRREARSRS